MIIHTGVSGNALPRSLCGGVGLSPALFVACFLEGSRSAAMKSILISNLNNLGDVICGTAGLDLIRRHYPDSRIGLMIRPDAEGAMRGHPLVDDLYVYRYRSGAGVRSILKMAREVRKGRYERFLSLDRKSRGALIAMFAGIRQRTMPDTLHLSTKPKWWMPLLCTRVLRYPQNSFRSLVEQFQDPVRKTLGIDGCGRTSLPPLSDANRAKAAELLASAGGRPIVGFSVKANASSKNWPADSFSGLMDRLTESHDIFAYVTGAPGDAYYISELIKNCRVARPANFAGLTSLMDAAALAASSDLFITLDTGAVHVAGNSGLRNLFCIFTATIPEGVLDSAPQARVFWTNEPCCPCSACPFPYEEAPCQLGISVDAVHAAAAEVLDAVRGGAPVG